MLKSDNAAGDPDAGASPHTQAESNTKPNGKSRVGRVVPDQSPGKTTRISIPVSNGGVFFKNHCLAVDLSKAHCFTGESPPTR
ncbi:hypothetical protein [Synechococcus sp. MIT S1220]|uniref:hypothetical protein n=1 Tax=Synechococcus sp. MIT S1220 TaxID=3082549 RepID=UPI0039B01CEC